MIDEHEHEHEHDDLDAPEDFEKEHVERPSFKEIWDNNPPLKIVAIFLAVVIAGFAYWILFPGEVPNHDKIRLNATSKTVPGTQESDAEYRKALVDVNKRDAAEQAKEGKSHVDIPVAITNNGTLEVPKMPEQSRSDVLAEWKRVADQGRMKAAKEAVDEENAAPQPEIVPMVQPVRPQEVKQDPNLAKRLADQMRQILAAQTPPKPSLLTITSEESPYEKKKKAEEAAKLAEASHKATTGANGGANGGNLGGNAKNPVKIIVPAGSIAYAQLMTALNSDLPGPVLAEVLSGPFTGGRLIGKITVNQLCQCLLIEYKTVVKDTISYKIDAVALDENTTLAGVDASSVDNHYLERYVLPGAASFLTGYSQALSTTGSTQELTSGVGATETQSVPSPKQSIFAGLTNMSQAIGQDLNKYAQRDPTIVINQGTTMGVFFTDTVTTTDAMQGGGYTVQ